MRYGLLKIRPLMAKFFWLYLVLSAGLFLTGHFMFYEQQNEPHYGTPSQRVTRSSQEISSEITIKGSFVST